jgi:hypothetical protein
MDTRWTTLALPPAAEASQAAALAEHRSQLKSDGRLVSAFVRPNALLGADAAPSLSRGTLTLPQGAHDSAYKTGRPESTIKALGMSRSATGTVLGVDLAGKISPRVGYTLHARSIDASGNVRFYDAAYNRTRLTPIRIGAQSVMRGGRVLSASGHRIELLLPPELMVGARWLMVGADTFQGGQTADHAAWQLLRVQPL